MRKTGRRKQREPFGRIRQLPSRRYQASYTGPDLALHKAASTFENADGRSGVADRGTATHRRRQRGWHPHRRNRAAELATFGAVRRRHGSLIVLAASAWSRSNDTVKRDLLQGTDADVRKSDERLPAARLAHGQPPPAPGAGAGGANSPEGLVAVEELVDRAVGSDVEVIDLVSVDRRPVRAGRRGG